MSLINKMLTDLEERHSYYRDQDQVVLGDLTPIADTGFSSIKIPYNFLLVCFFLVAIAVAFYRYTGNESGGLYYPESASSASVVTETINQNQMAQMTDLSPSAASELSSLKLDLSLPLVSAPTPSQAVVIEAIDMSEADGITRIQLWLDSASEYRVYSLPNPSQVVLEIDHAELLAALPQIADHPYIERFRFSNQQGERFQLIIDTAQTVRIDNAEMIVRDDSNVLSLSLSPASVEKIELIPTLPAVAQAEETTYGQMDIRPSTTTPQMSADRLLSEAKALYARRDFGQADVKIQALLKQQPLHVEARLLYVSALIARGNVATASQMLGDGLRLDPGISEWAKVYARLLVDQGQTLQAVEVLAYALPQISQDQEYYAFYAALLQGLARHDEAAEFYRVLLNEQPDNRVWWMGLGISLDALNDMSEAVYAYNRALEGDALNYELRQYVLQQTERLTRQN